MSLYFKCLYIILLFLITTNAPAQERLALVIGNSDYQDGSDLKNPVNDATDLAAVLSQLDFKVIHKQNLNLREMKQAINQFGNKLRKSGGVGLFYFSGHGMQHDGANYLIPIGAMRSLNVAEQLPYEAVNAGYVLAAMKKTAKNQLNIVILDACRNNPFKSLFKGVGRIAQDGLITPQTPGGFLIAYATAAGKVAIDGNERNSPYVKHLMREILKPNILIEQMLKQVRVAVKNETHGIQHPAYYAAIDQDFAFNAVLEEKVSPKVVTPIEPKQVAPASSSSFFEKLKWVSVIIILLIWGFFKTETGKLIFLSLMLFSPLLIPSLALGFEFLPNPAKTWSPEVYLWISAGFIGISLFMTILNDELQRILMVGGIIIGIIAIFTAGFLVIGVAVIMGFLIFIILVIVDVEEDFIGFLSLLVIADYIFLVYYCFFDGWKLFV